MKNNTDNPRQVQELWQKLKLQTTNTKEKLKTWIVALPKNQIIQYITKKLCVFAVAYCTIKLLSTIQTLLPIVITVYLAKMLYQNGYKLDNKISEFLIKHQFIDSAQPEVEPEFEYFLGLTGNFYWRHKDCVGKIYDKIGGYPQTIMREITYLNKVKTCILEATEETIKELIK
jgi:hypothetical protein